MNLETKDIIKEEIKHKIKSCLNEILDYLEIELNKPKETLLNQWLEITILNNRIDKAIETINLMIYKGYTISNKETARSYMATGENSEFGVRAKELLNILKGDEKNDK